MKKQKRNKRSPKRKAPDLTADELKKALLDAGFVFVHDRKTVFGKPEKDLHQGETVIFPEGSTKGIPVR
jgi:predicted RNA binding protein YcfA (HicA-like mRNA interferase family)